MVSHLHQEMELEGTLKTLWLDYINPPLAGPRDGRDLPVLCVVFFISYLPLPSTSLRFLLCLSVALGEDTGLREREGGGTALWFATHRGLHGPTHLVIESCTFLQPNTKILTLLDIIGISRYISTI